MSTSSQPDDRVYAPYGISDPRCEPASPFAWTRQCRVAANRAMRQRPCDVATHLNWAYVSVVMPAPSRRIGFSSLLCSDRPAASRASAAASYLVWDGDHGGRLTLNFGRGSIASSSAHITVAWSCRQTFDVAGRDSRTSS